MRFFNRNNNSAAAIPEDLQPYYSSSNSGVRRWIGPILRGLLLLLILALLVWGAIWLVNKVRASDGDNKPATNNGQSTQKQGSNAANSPAANDNKNDANKTPAPAPTPTPAPGAAAPAPATPPAAPAPAPKAAVTPPSSTQRTPAPVATPTPTPSRTPAPTPAPVTGSVTPTPGSGAGEVKQLANAGPGHVIAAFLVTLTSGVLLFRSYILRSMKRS